MTVIRPATATDLPFLWDMLYEAIFVPPGQAAPPRSVLQDPRVDHYLRDFPSRPGDAGLIADTPQGPAGAAWHRRLPAHDPGYGFVRADVPEVTIALAPAFRGQGLGTKLLERLLADAAAAGHPGLSLSVQVRNRARHLYERLGFIRVAGLSPDDSAWTMWHPL